MKCSINIFRFVYKIKDYIYRKLIKNDIVKYTDYVIKHSQSKVGHNCLLYNGSLGDESWLVEIGNNV